MVFENSSNHSKTHRRKKTQRQIPLSATGEEFGLVPSKYLKRKTAVEDAAVSSSTTTTPSLKSFKDTSAAAAAAGGGGGTPPRKMTADTVPNTPETIKTAVSAASTTISTSNHHLPPLPTPVRLFAEANNTIPEESSSKLSLSSSVAPSAAAKNGSGGNSSQDRHANGVVAGTILKDTTPAPILVKTPQERKVALNGLNRSLKQRGFPSSLISSPFVEEWKLCVLRAEGYNVAKATTRVLQHWKVKSELFGTPDLKVTMKDIAPNLVQSGCIQLAPTRDLAGRAIVCVRFHADLYSSQEREIKKYLFYMLSSALEDEETQDRGIVLVVWNDTHQQQQHDGALMSSTSFATATNVLFSPSAVVAAASPSSWAGGVMSSLFDSFWNLWKSIKPAFQISRLHYITIDPSATYALKEWEEITNSTILRHHIGSAQICLHALLTFGIPLPALPMSSAAATAAAAATWQTGLYWQQWVEWRQRTDSYHHQQQYSITLVPTRYDVLFGKHAVINAGNVQFHQSILAHVDQYRVATNAQQVETCRSIYQSLTQPPPKNDDGDDDVEEQQQQQHRHPPAKCLRPLDARLGSLWEPMDETTAIAKIADAFEFVIRQMEFLEQQRANQDDDNNNNNNYPRGRKGNALTDPHAAWEWDFLGVRSCCFVLTCQDGYRVCGGGSGKDWQR